MKKPVLYLIFLTPITARSTNPLPVGLSNEQVAVPIDSMLFLLFTAGIVFGSYTIFKKEIDLKFNITCLINP